MIEKLLAIQKDKKMVLVGKGMKYHQQVREFVNGTWRLIGYQIREYLLVLRLDNQNIQYIITGFIQVHRKQAWINMLRYDGILRVCVMV